jgi:hypothetical protein
MSIDVSEVRAASIIRAITVGSSIMRQVFVPMHGDTVSWCKNVCVAHETHRLTARCEPLACDFILNCIHPNK